MAVINTPFYSESDPSIFGILDDAEERDCLSQLGAVPIPLKEANDLFPYELVKIIHNEGLDFATPPGDSSALVLLAGHFMYHDEINIESQTLEDMLTDFINENFLGDKYVFSSSQEDFLALKFKKYSPEIMRSIYMHHWLMPFIIFSERRDAAVLINFDLYVTAISLMESHCVGFGGRSDSYWNGRFEKDFLNVIPGRKEHIDFVQEHFVRVLPR